MTTKRFSSIAAPACGAALALALLAGCATPVTHYYTLASSATAPTNAAAAPPQQWIELAPLALPERLARPQLVVRAAGSSADGAQLKVLEQHRWVASFENEMRDALASGIAAELGAFDASKTGRPTGAPSTRIQMQLRQFDAIEGDSVQADWGWTLRNAEGGASRSCQIRLREPVAGAGIDALAQGAQRLTALSADAVARSVRAWQADPAAACPG